MARVILCKSRQVGFRHQLEVERMGDGAARRDAKSSVGGESRKDTIYREWLEGRRRKPSWFLLLPKKEDKC